MLNTDERTESQHCLVDFAGSFLAQEPRMITLNGKQRHDTYNGEMYRMSPFVLKDVVRKYETFSREGYRAEVFQFAV